MTSQTTGASRTIDETPPRWRLIGPGLVVAATGVGAADLVATLVAGSLYGYMLLWAAILGAVMKLVLVEGAGRFSLATGRTMFEGWQSLGRWTSWYFGPYIVIWGFVYGAAAMAATGLAMYSLLPVLGVASWGVIAGLVGLVLVWIGRYGLLEKVLGGMVLLMFVSMVGAAAVVVPNLPDLVTGLVPRIPADDGLFYMLSLAGGVGGTITLAAYGYWLREKGWDTPRHMRVMRIDNGVAYGMTGLFVVATLIVGAELLYSAQIAVSSSDEGLVDLAGVLENRYGTATGTIFLAGFGAAAMSSLVGVWNGVSLMFADFVAHARGMGADHPDARSGGRYYKAYLLWLTLPPMVMLYLGKPVYLILAYGFLGAFFMPFLAVTLLWLLNSDRVPEQWRNRLPSNIAMGVIALAFVALAANELYGLVTGA
jgi:Mn2+/Fe2+ NRAMP family transporter